MKEVISNFVRPLSLPFHGVRFSTQLSVDKGL